MLMNILLETPEVDGDNEVRYVNLRIQSCFEIVFLHCYADV